MNGYCVKNKKKRCTYKFVCFNEEFNKNINYPEYDSNTIFESK